MNDIITHWAFRRLTVQEFVMVNMYLQLVVIECTNVASFDQMSEELIKLMIA